MSESNVKKQISLENKRLQTAYKEDVSRQMSEKLLNIVKKRKKSLTEDLECKIFKMTEKE